MPGTFNLEKEVRSLAAHRDINDAICRYFHGLDRLLPDVQLSAFHDDAFVNSGYLQGSPQEFVEFAQKFVGEMVSTQHTRGQAHITVDLEADCASGEVYFMAQHRIVEEGEAKDLFIAGRYIDEYSSKSGDWRISKRIILVDWSRTEAACDRYMKENVAVTPLGKRGVEDFSVHRSWPT